MQIESCRTWGRRGGGGGVICDKMAECRCVQLAIRTVCSPALTVTFSANFYVSYLSQKISVESNIIGYHGNKNCINMRIQRNELQNTLRLTIKWFYLRELFKKMYAISRSVITYVYVYRFSFPKWEIRTLIGIFHSQVTENVTFQRTDDLSPTVSCLYEVCAIKWLEKDFQNSNTAALKIALHKILPKQHLRSKGINLSLDATYTIHIHNSSKREDQRKLIIFAKKWTLSQHYKKRHTRLLFIFHRGKSRRLSDVFSP